MDFTELLNERSGGLNRLLGVTFEKVDLDEVIAVLQVGPQHHQPYGLVHGGLYSVLVETVCSAGAGVNAMQRGEIIVGLDNSTSFIRATREGTLRARGTPVHRGRRSQMWKVEITRDDGKLVATGRVRLLCLEAGAKAAGEVLGFKET